MSWQLSSRYEEVVAAFFMKHTKKELEKLSLKYNLRLSIINDIVDNAEGETLTFRGYWTDVGYPELGIAIKSPSHLFLSNEVKTQVRFRAPRIGEHNTEIFEKELGLSKQKMFDLKTPGVVGAWWSPIRNHQKRTIRERGIAGWC